MTRLAFCKLLHNGLVLDGVVGAAVQKMQLRLGTGANQITDICRAIFFLLKKEWA